MTTAGERKRDYGVFPLYLFAREPIAPTEFSSRMEGDIYLIYYHGQTRDLHNFLSFRCPQLAHIVNGTPTA